MTRITWCVGVVTLLLSGITEAAAPAGIVLYCQSGGEIYLLLAEHAESTRGWAGFGGSGREGETVAETAARKAEEETRGYFKRAEMLQKIKGQSPVVDGDFATYFVEVAFVPAQRVMNHPVPRDDDAYLERSTFAWIPYSIMEGFLKEDVDRTRTYLMDRLFLPAGSQTQWLWTAWLRSMRKAMTIQALPWKAK